MVADQYERRGVIHCCSIDADVLSDYSCKIPAVNSRWSQGCSSADNVLVDAYVEGLWDINWTDGCAEVVLYNNFHSAGLTQTTKEGHGAFLDWLQRVRVVVPRIVELLRLVGKLERARSRRVSWESEADLQTCFEWKRFISSDAFVEERFTGVDSVEGLRNLPGRDD